MKIKLAFLFLSMALVLPFCLSFLEGGWLDRKAEGWAWYEDVDEDKKLEEIPVSAPIPSSPVLTTETKLAPVEEIAKVRKELEEKLAEALLQPNPENVATYMKLQKRWIDQSGLFAQTWAQVLLENPSLDETVKFPISQYGIQVQKQILQEQKDALIRQLAQERGLFFFYEGKSKASIIFAMVVKEFAKRYGWTVLAVAIDGIKIEGFQNNQPDNGISKSFGVEVTPCLYVVHPQSREVVPISFGLSSLNQIEDNIVLQFTEEASL
ncbi:type-F conjugative transfer system pilin assembly protein TraF [Candidatus Protochlamydia phocaeensis]|uniref:type-F conjugative transfer system pilin assembly protein TraF n=1 Tax=Candidatus Protochlamydia phocaeensis TaxID=1414722 RepID=UPI0008387580|nr:type-F conjugative transfer system pilin assembly protein TraF [Candidatus Protochlamydia phocaeensis]